MSKVKKQETEQDNPAAFELQDFLPYRLSVVTNRISRAFSRHYSHDFGLSIPEWRVLAVLGAFAPLSSNEICDRTAMDKAKVSRAVAALSHKGYLTRESNPDDHRLIALRHSLEGQAVFEEILPLARRLEEQLTSALAPGEREQLENLLSKLDQSISLSDS
ncbi:MarR family winged helix-turn-helix transcriptional regulator [Rhodovibrionaceae bacterium A322]